MHANQRRNGRVAEGAPLLRVYRLIAYRGFESLFLRHNQTLNLCFYRGFLFLTLRLLEELHFELHLR